MTASSFKNDYAPQFISIVLSTDIINFTILKKKIGKKWKKQNWKNKLEKKLEKKSPNPDTVALCIS